jgi:uncharacterized protein (DUF305 family)
MKKILKAASATLVFFATTTVMPLTASAELTFPEKCKSDMSMPAGLGGHDMSMPGMADMHDHQKESMEGMKAMSTNMMHGMMKEDADVAYACAMIAHHMGAISMAEVELKHGDNDETKANAQKVIEEQTKEIEELTSWVEKKVK